MKQNKWDLIKEGAKVVSVCMMLTIAAVAIRTMIWMPQIF